ncbi:hypothetical protein SynA1562_02016 [Synechococcus sp. A15-62]|nr:hypothetical protein SynA1562_02016 [Synechococcus sp. A15-62]
MNFSCQRLVDINPKAKKHLFGLCRCFLVDAKDDPSIFKE